MSFNGLPTHAIQLNSWRYNKFYLGRLTVQISLERPLLSVSETFLYCFCNFLPWAEVAEAIVISSNYDWVTAIVLLFNCILTQ